MLSRLLLVFPSSPLHLNNFLTPFLSKSLATNCQHPHTEILSHPSTKKQRHFLYPAAPFHNNTTFYTQLAAILHASHQIFEAAPHSRPDIPVSYWSKFLFSESYLARVNPNLALNILTAVSNPITNDGRSRLAKGCLAHR